MKTRILLFGSMGILALTAGFLPSAESIRKVFHSYGYYFTFFAVLLWVLKILSCYGKRIPEILYKHISALILSLVLTSCIFAISPPRFKILADEANLAGVSLAMYKEKVTSIPVENISSDGEPDRYRYSADKRPLLYPLLVSFLHTLTGYRASNCFLINFISGALSLFCGYLLSSRFFPKSLGCSAIWILSGFPIFCFWTTSAGFETLNLFFVLFVFLFLSKFLDENRTGDLEILFLSLVLLAQCRYESALFSIAMIFMLPVISLKDHISKLSFSTLILPFLFLPVLWQRIIFHGYTEPVRIAAERYQVQTGAFHSDSFMINLKKNLFVLSGFDPSFGFSPILFLLCLLGVYLIFRKAVMDNAGIPDGKKRFFAYLSITFLFLFSIICSYRWGDFSFSSSNRFALVFLAYMIFPILFFLGQLMQRRLIAPYALPVLSIFHLFYVWPYAAEQRLIKTLSLQYEYHRVCDFISSRYDTEKSLLIISGLPNLYIIQKYRVIHISTANKRAEYFGGGGETEFEKTVAIQKCHRETGTPLEKERLAQSYKLKTLKEININPEIFVRISEIQK